MMIQGLLTVLAYTPPTSFYAPPRRPARAWASCTDAGTELADEPAAPVQLPPLPILLRTDSYVFIAKPSGTVVHRGKFTKRGDVPLLQRLRDQLGVRVNPVLSPSPSPSLIPSPNRYP